MEKIYDVVALGELLIDFTDSGSSSQGNPMFEANPGGAPGNVLAMLSKLGRHTAFIGKVGDDIFGHQLKAVLTEAGLDTRNLVMTADVRTTLAFVKNTAAGEREFSFYRNPGADMMLNQSEVDEELLGAAKIFHFGTLSMTHEEVRTATMYAVRTAKEHGALLSFDPNIRESLWESLADAREQMEAGLKLCDILKISDNEIQWFTGEEDYAKGVQRLQEQYHIPLILLSLGKDGSRAYYQDICVEAAAFIQEQTIETTGAGDTFFGSCLNFILEYGLANLTTEILQEMLTFANAAASIITTRKGALRVMPERTEIEQLVTCGL